MIARTWRGAVRAADAETYADYIRDTGIYPEDDRYLVERDLIANHFVVAASSEGGMR